MGGLARILLAVGAVAAAIFASQSKVEVNNLAAQLNKLYPPHATVLAKNPSSEEFPWAAKLQTAMPQILEEFIQVSTAQGLAMLPEKAYLSKSFQGGLEEASFARQSSGKEWEWAMLRAGMIDTCLATYFKQTMGVLDSLKVPVHTAFFSVLHPGKSLPPHCGETRALYRFIMVLDLLGPPSDGNNMEVQRSTMSVLEDHDMCMTRFAKSCPKELARNSTHVNTVEYGVGDMIIFNDFVCHWVENGFTRPRLALIINVEREDIPMWKRWLMRGVTKAYMLAKGGKFRSAAEKACDKLGKD